MLARRFWHFSAGPAGLVPWFSRETQRWNAGLFSTQPANVLRIFKYSCARFASLAWVDRHFNNQGPMLDYARWNPLIGLRRIR